jgi:hypothetical protein
VTTRTTSTLSRRLLGRLAMLPALFVLLWGAAYFYNCVSDLGARAVGADRRTGICKYDGKEFSEGAEKRTPRGIRLCRQGQWVPVGHAGLDLHQNLPARPTDR